MMEISKGQLHTNGASARTNADKLKCTTMLYTFKRPLSPPQEIQPCSEFQETHRNPTPLGIAIWEM